MAAPDGRRVAGVSSGFRPIVLDASAGEFFAVVEFGNRGFVLRVGAAFLALRESSTFARRFGFCRALFNQSAAHSFSRQPKSDGGSFTFVGVATGLDRRDRKNGAISFCAVGRADFVRFGLHGIAWLSGFRYGWRDGTFAFELAPHHAIDARCESVQLPGRLQLSFIFAALACSMGLSVARHHIAGGLLVFRCADDALCHVCRQRVQAICHNKTRRFESIAPDLNLNF